MRAIRTGRKPYRVEFSYVGGSRPYLRIGRPDLIPEYAGSVDGRKAIRRLRDYLTAALGNKSK